MAAAGGAFLWIVWHVKQLASVFLGRTNVHEGLSGIDMVEDVIAECADGAIGILGPVSRAFVGRAILHKLATLLPPFHPATIHDADLLVAVILEEPERIAGEPVGLVTVEDNGAILRDAQIRAELLELRFG